MGAIYVLDLWSLQRHIHVS